ncbi:MAG: hypothetical protein ACYSWQ_27695 [Planctomycetota bacterium]|jgi:apolipoprotein N-acyltransferase
MSKNEREEPPERRGGLGRWTRQAGPLAGFLSGALLMVAGIFPALAPLQAFAFVPLLLALRRIHRWRDCLHTGFLMGLGGVTASTRDFSWASASSLHNRCG